MPNILQSISVTHCHSLWSIYNGLHMRSSAQDGTKCSSKNIVSNSLSKENSNKTTSTTMVAKVEQQDFPIV